MNIRSFEELNDILIDVGEIGEIEGGVARGEVENNDIKLEEMDYDNDDFELDESNVRNRSKIDSAPENVDSDNDNAGYIDNEKSVDNEFLKRSVNFIDIRGDEDSVVTSMDFSTAKDGYSVDNSMQHHSNRVANHDNTTKWKQAKESPTKLTHTPPKVIPTIKPYLSANTHNNNPVIVGGNGPVGRYSNVKIAPKQDIPGIKVTVNNKVIPVKALDAKNEINENLYGLIQGLVDDAAKKKNDNKKMIDKVALHAVPVKNIVRNSANTLPNSNYLDDIYDDDLTRSMTAGVTSVAKGEKLIREITKQDKKISFSTDVTDNNKEKEHERQLEEALLKLGINKHELNNKSELIYAQFLSDMINLCRARAKASNTIEEMAMHRVLANHLQQSFTTNNVVNKVRNDMTNNAVETILKYKKK